MIEDESHVGMAVDRRRACLNGAGAIQSFLQTKSVRCELSIDVQDPFVIKA